METITTNTKTVELTGEEIHVQFTSAFPYFWLRNDGSSTVLMSLSPNIEEGKDGVIEVPAGSSAGTEQGTNNRKQDLYIIGNGKVQVMGTEAPNNPFKEDAKGGGENAKAKPLVLFEGSEDGYNFADGITGINILNDIPCGYSINYKKNNIDPWENTVNIGLEKAFSISGHGTAPDPPSEYIDSALFALNNDVDLTGYSYILVDCFYYTDYSTSDYVSGMGGAYFRIGEPDNLPQSRTTYDWGGNGWTSMNIKSNRTPITFFHDISGINGLQKICFGVLHGTYKSSYTNILRIHKIILV